jgi:ATP-dependent Clp endopeptidase proteolytic subunit ClpP
MHKMSKPKANFYEILNKSAETKTVDILIYGTIPSFEEDSWKMKNTAERFVVDFKAMEKEYDRINIHINSPGGSLYHGFPIFNAIVNSKKDVHTYNDGLAASMGGLLLLAGKKVHMAKNAMLMIHNALSFAYGNSQELKDHADKLDKYDGIIAQHFADKSGKDIADIQTKYLDYKDHFLTADEALKEGFVDVIEDYESEDAPPSNIANMAFSEVMALYKPKEDKEQSFFDKVVNHIRTTFNLGDSPNTPPAAPQPPNGGGLPAATDKSPTTTNTYMNFENSISHLNKEALTAEDIAAIRAEIQAYNAAGEKFTHDEVQAQITAALEPVSAEVTALATAKTDLENQLSNLTNEKATLATEKANLETENKSIKVVLESYRKTGVKIDNEGSQDPDKIEGEDTEENFYSEADEEVKRMRNELKRP